MQKVPMKMGPTIKVKNLPLRSKFFPFREVLSSFEKQMHLIRGCMHPYRMLTAAKWSRACIWVSVFWFAVLSMRMCIIKTFNTDSHRHYGKIHVVVTIRWRENHGKCSHRPIYSNLYLIYLLRSSKNRKFIKPVGWEGWNNLSDYFLFCSTFEFKINYIQ